MAWRSSAAESSVRPVVPETLPAIVKAPPALFPLTLPGRTLHCGNARLTGPSGCQGASAVQESKEANEPTLRDGIAALDWRRIVECRRHQRLCDKSNLYARQLQAGSNGTGHPPEVG